MALFTNYSWIYDLRKTFNDIFQQFLTLTKQGFPVSSPVLTTKFGHRAILLTWQVSTDSFEVFYVYAPLGSAQTCPARLMLQKPGFDGNSVGDYGNGSTLLRPTFPTVIDYWRLTILLLKEDILTVWCNATVVAIVPTSTTSGTNKIASAIGVLIITAKAEMMVSSESLYGLNFDDPTFSNGYLLAVPSVVVGIGNAAFGVSPQIFDEVNANLQLIALRDYQISFNHSQTIFSAMGGIVTG